MKRLIVISTWFQCLWFMAVLGTDVWQLLTVILTLATYVLSYVYLSARLIPAVLIAIVGITIDSLNIQLGVLIFSQPVWGSEIANAWIPPLWLISLWFMFAWYASFLVPAVSHFPRTIVSVTGGVMGSLSYMAGNKLEAVELGYSAWISVGVLFVEWALISYLVLRVFHEVSDFHRSRYTDQCS